jgi:hypothetical protein
VSDLISTDAPFTASQQALLGVLLDTLVPASDELGMPSAAEVDFSTYLRTQAEDFIAELIAILEHFEASFAELSITGRCERVSEFSASDPAMFQALLTRVYDCYYQSDRVRGQIGVVTGAPFPQGNEVTQGDLSLLDPVIRNSARYRYRSA